jgi:hypothetical protein
MDDYPHGMPDHESLSYLGLSAISIFNEHEIPYLLGVSPLLLNDSDIAKLNEIVKSGWVCMHGFNHKFDHKPWSNITSTWSLGGEFAGLTEQEISDKFDRSEGIISRIKKYDPEHFIAPFNCYTQAAINVLEKKGIKYLHTCDKEWDDFHYEKLDHKSITPIISKYKVTYDYANQVIKHLDDPSQITIHWIFDTQLSGWQEHYTKLAIALKSSSPSSYSLL